MPALPPVVDVIEIQLGWTLGSDTAALSRVHFAISGTAPSAADCVTIATGVRSAWSAHLASRMTSNKSLRSVTVTDLTTATGARGVNATPVPGTEGGTPQPRGTGMLFVFGIARRYRGGKPRVSLPLGSAGDIDSSGIYVPATIAFFNPPVVDFLNGITGLTGGGCTVGAQVNVSYVAGHTWTMDARGNWHREPTYRGTPVVDVVTSVTMSSRVATNRRRNRA